MKQLNPQRSAALLRKSFILWSRRAPTTVTIEQLAAEARVDADYIRHWYTDVETLLRLTVDEAIKELAAPLANVRHDGLLQGGMLEYAHICAQLFASETYGRLCYVVVRDAPVYPWLVKKHDALIEQVQLGVNRVVREARDERGMKLEIRASGFLQRSSARAGASDSASEAQEAHPSRCS
jgi:hypothetical protein